MRGINGCEKDTLLLLGFSTISLLNSEQILFVHGLDLYFASFPQIKRARSGARKVSQLVFCAMVLLQVEPAPDPPDLLFFNDFPSEMTGCFGIF